MKPHAISRQLRIGNSVQLFWTLVVATALVLAQTLAANAQSRPDSFADLAESVSPAVVNITISASVESALGVPEGVPEGSPFEDHFRDFLEREGPGNNGQRRSQALGSGFIISGDGFIVTNHHVIDGADQILVELFAGDELPAEVIGSDPNTDLALLKVNSPTPLPFVEWGDSDAMRVGDWVLAVGNPLGQGFSVSAGVVSARGRALSGSFDDFIQTDAAINRGNSGGPLFNLDGDVVGVNTAILSPNGGSIGIGFSMSSKVATNVIDQLQEFGETRRGWLGVRVQEVSGDVAGAMGMGIIGGALVTDVPPGPAQDAGIRAGDVIMSFNGDSIEDTRDLVQRVANSPVGAEVRVIVFRDGANVPLIVTLGRRETAEATPASAPADEPIEEEILGITLSPMTPNLRRQLGLNQDIDGLVVRDVRLQSDAYSKGLRSGDLIVEAGQQAVTQIDEFESLLAEALDAGRKSILLLVRRNGEPRFVAIGTEEG